MHTSIEPRLISRSQLLFLLACVLGTLPVFLSAYPPMVDLPQHAAQISLLDGMLRGDTPFAELLELQWFTPYWLGYALIYLFSQLFGIVLATKLTVALAVLAFPLCTDRFLRQHGGNPVWSYLFIPLAYGSAYEWGFLNFILAVPLGFLFLSQIRDRSDQELKGEWLRIAVWGHLLFFAHALVLAFFWPAAALMQYRRNFRLWLRLLAPYLLVAPVVLAWITIRVATKTEFSDPTLWDYGLHRIVLFLPNLAALPQSLPGQIAGAALLALPWLAGWRIIFRVNRIAPFGLFLLVAFLAPHIIFDISFVADRFGYVGLPLYFYMFGRPSLEPSSVSEQRRGWAGIFAIMMATSMLGFGIYRVSAYDSESRGYRDIMAHAEPGKRVLQFPLHYGSEAYQTPIYLHYPLWYHATHRGLVDFNFARFVPQVVRYKPEQRPMVDGRFVWAPNRFDWTRHEGRRYDYFVVRYPQDVMTRLFPPGAVRMVARSGEWWLYARND